MANDAHLVAVKDDKGVPARYYRCSLCNAELSRNPRNPEEMAVKFAAHISYAHKAPITEIESIIQDSIDGVRRVRLRK